MRNIAIALLSLLALSTLAQAPPAEIRAAREKLDAKDFDGAIAILEDFTTKNPQRGAAIQLLASAYAQKGDTAAAINTYEKLSSFPALRANAWFEIAAIHLAQNDKTSALEALARVRASGSFDYDRLRTDTRFDSLRTDRAFLALLPGPRDFDNPFVEKTRVIHELRGEGKGGQFGWIARRIGDVDGDKVADFVTSAPTYSVDGSPAGRVYVYSSRQGKLLWQHTGKAGEQLGIGVEAAGDTNRDGIPDVVASGPGSGHVYVFSGRDGTLLLTSATAIPADSSAATPAPPATSTATVMPMSSSAHRATRRAPDAR